MEKGKYLKNLSGTLFINENANQKKYAVVADCEKITFASFQWCERDGIMNNEVGAYKYEAKYGYLTEGDNHNNLMLCSVQIEPIKKNNPDPSMSE